MAITFITGVARSGKSYFSTYNLYKMYKPELKKINFFMQWFRYYILPLQPKKYYDTTFTNINEFNFDFNPRIKKLVFKDLIAKLSILHDLHVNQGKDDKHLVKVCKTLGLYNCLFVIDEAAHYLTKPIDNVLVWWFTYHGHLFHDIHVISQHLDQIPNEYLKNGEHFFIAYPPSSAIFKNKLTYGSYKNGKFFKNGKIRDFSVPLVPKVYDMYVSGKLPDRKPILKKFIPIFLLLFGFLYFAISNFFSTNDEMIMKNNPEYHKEDESNKIVSLEDDSIDIDKKKIDYSTSSFLELQCIKDVCKSKLYKDIPLSFVLFIFENNTLEYVEKKQITYQYSKYYVLLDDSSIDMLNKSFLIKKPGRINKSLQREQSVKLF